MTGNEHRFFPIKSQAQLDREAAARRWREQNHVPSPTRGQLEAAGVRFPAPKEKEGLLAGGRGLKSRRGVVTDSVMDKDVYDPSTDESTPWNGRGRDGEGDDES